MSKEGWNTTMNKDGIIISTTKEGYWVRIQPGLNGEGNYTAELNPRDTEILIGKLKEAQAKIKEIK